MKYLLVLGMLCCAASATAQSDHVALLKNQLETRIAEEIAGVDGIIGLAILDLVSGEEIAVNGDLVFPQASAIKIPILIELMRQVSTGTADPGERLEFRSEIAVGGAGILQRFEDSGSALSLHDLAVLMIVLSDNTATNMLIDRIGMNSVNEMLDEAGFANIRLQRRMMDTEASARNEENIATPRSAAAIMAELHRGEMLGAEVTQQILEILALPKSTLMDGPGGAPVYNKTGSLEGVSVEWALVDLPRRPYVFVFMSMLAEAREARVAAATISRLAHRYFSLLSRVSDHGVLVDPSLLDP